MNFKSVFNSRGKSGKIINLMIVLILVTSVLLGMNQVDIVKASSSAVTFTPVADAYVESSSATTNYGVGSTMRIDGSPEVRSYLRFDVHGLTAGTVSKATLSIYANSASTIGFSARQVADTSWQESQLNFNNAPELGAQISLSAGYAAGTWVNLDVTSYINDNGTYSLALTTATATASSLAARESGANAPKLLVETTQASTPTQVGATSAPTAKPTAAPTTAPTTKPTATLTATPVGTQPASCSAVTLTKGPTLILTGNNTQMRVFWQWSANSAFTVQWGASTSYGSSAGVSAKDTTNHLYQYDISGLTPGSKYYYRVVTGSQCASGSFYAPPASSATSIKFFSYGDTRTNGSTHNSLAGRVDSAFAADPAFQTLNINVGDWVSGDSESAWTGEWFASGYTNIRKQDANIADIGVRGNHESGATYWKRYWPEPFQSGGLYWSFDYGPMHVIMLDQYTSYAPGSAQYNWLKADLAASTKTWKFVVFHEPGWSAGGGHANNTSVQQNLQPLFTQFGVSIVFAGHNHYYARASVSGVTHLTMGGGGAPSYTPASGQANIVKTVSGNSFGEFSISGKTLTAQIINNSGSVVDSFTITR